LPEIWPFSILGTQNHPPHKCPGMIWRSCCSFLALGDKFLVWQVSCYPSISLSTPIFMPGEGMCMGPRFFHWSTITGRCLPGALRLPCQIASGRRGIDLPEIWGKLTFRPNLCYSATCEKNWPREEDRLGDFTRAKRLQNLLGTETDRDAA